MLVIDFIEQLQKMDPTAVVYFQEERYESIYETNLVNTPVDKVETKNIRLEQNDKEWPKYGNSENIVVLS